MTTGLAHKFRYQTKYQSFKHFYGRGRIVIDIFMGHKA